MMTPEQKAEFDQRVVAWQQLKARIAKEYAPLVAQEMEARKALMAEAFPAAVDGTNNLDLGHGWVLKGVKSLEYKLPYAVADQEATNAAFDAIEALGNEGAFIYDRLVTWTPKLSVSEYKKLDPNNPTHQKIKAIIDGVLIVKDAAPTIEVVPPKTT